MTHPQTPEPSRTLVARPPDRTPAVAVRPLTSEFGLGAPLAAGEVGVLGPYRIVRELGKGGMGAVYLAVDTRLDRELALKVMLPAFAADPASKERFLREAKAVAKVAHDHVVTIFEADERDGVPYIAMQFLQGAPLDEYLKKKGSPGVAQCVRIVREAALGLAAAHARGLVHRDIKPANLWLEAPNGRVKVLDFGLAKPVGSETEITRSGVVMGTPSYMSPEQARGQKVDARTDIFSLGAVLYRLLTGRNPFLGDHIMAVLTALAVEEPTPVRELNPNVPAALADFVNQLLAKKPEARPQTAHEVAERLRTILSQPAVDVSASVPVVVQPLPVPMIVTAPESAFANLTDDEEDDDRTEREAEPLRAEEREPKRGKGLLIAGGALALVAVVGVAIALGTGGKKPDGVAKGPDLPAPQPPVTKKDKEKDKDKPAPSAPKAECAAAEWVLSLGGSVSVTGAKSELRAADDLPKQPFALIAADLNGTGVTDALLANFSGLGELGYLQLVNTQITDAGLARLTGINSLRMIRLQGTKVTDAGLAHLRNLGLTGLAVEGLPISDAGLANLKGAIELRNLWLENTKVTDVGLEHLTGLKGLENLNLTMTKVTEAGVKKLAKGLSACRIVWDGGTIEPTTKVGDDRAAAQWALSVGGKVFVRKLPGGAEVVTEAAKVPAGEFRVLRIELNDLGPKVTDAGLARLRGLPELHTLELYAASGVTDEGLAHLADSPALEVLVIGTTKVTGTGLVHTKNLLQLQMYGTPVSEDGLKRVAELTKLTHTPDKEAEAAAAL